MIKLLFPILLLVGCGAPPEGNFLQEEDSTAKIKIHPDQLSTEAFRLNGFDAGLKSFMGEDVPVLTWLPNPKIDYIQLIRCKENAAIDDVDVWQSMLNSKACEEVHAPGVSSKAFKDLSYPNTAFRYFGRACVLKNRFIEEAEVTMDQCSPLVSVTSEISRLKTNRSQEEFSSLALAGKSYARLDQLGRDVLLHAENYSAALNECKIANNKNYVSLQRKQALTRVIGAGITIADELLSPDLGAAAVISGASTWLDLANSTWMPSPAGQAEQISSVLMNLFASPDDYRRSCTKAAEALSKGQITVLEMKSTQLRWASEMDNTEAARKKRLGGGS